jgi:hypothetical protein
MSRPRILLLALALAAVVAAPAPAQYNPYYPYPYNPYYPYGWRGAGYGTGAALSGAASVLSSSGQLTLDTQRAYQQREFAKQEALRTKKMAFDQMMYEKANTPTYTEEMEKNEAMRLRRMMQAPAQAEVLRGDTLNAMLPIAAGLATQGVPGPPLTIRPDLLRSINVTATAGGGTGMLKDVGRLNWPIALRGPDQKKLDAKLQLAVSQTMRGELDAKTYKEVRSGIAKMRDDITQQFRKDQLDSRGYVDGKHFLDRLAQSVEALQDADAAKYLDGSFAPRGGTVAELAQNLTAQGLRFAPAVPGQEAAYNALNGLFVAYLQSSQPGPAFQARATPKSKAGAR